MAVALSGAVLVEDRGNLVNYRKKCERCGHVEGGGTTTSAPSKGNTLVSSFNCQKCRSHNEVRIMG